MLVTERIIQAYGKETGRNTVISFFSASGDFGGSASIVFGVGRNEKHSRSPVPSSDKIGRAHV